MSISNFDSSNIQIPIIMSIEKKSLFKIKRGLDFSDASSIYVSFVSLIPSDLYLRHENGRIIIEKNDQTILFRQDATFKLIFDYEKDFVAIQAINLPDYFYLAVDNEEHSNLTLKKCEEQTPVNELDQRFLFKIIPAT
jgi:hypothetical protein